MRMSTHLECWFFARMCCSASIWDLLGQGAAGGIEGNHVRSLCWDSSHPLCPRVCLGQGCSSNHAQRGESGKVPWKPGESPHTMCDTMKRSVSSEPRKSHPPNARLAYNEFIWKTDTCRLISSTNLRTIWGPFRSFIHLCIPRLSNILNTKQSNFCNGQTQDKHDSLIFYFILILSFQ